MYRRALLLLTAVSFGCNLFAGTITYTRTIGLQPTNWDEQIVIPKYDGALPLLSVYFALGGDVQADITITNGTEIPNDVTAFASGSLQLTRPDATSILAIFPYSSSMWSLGPAPDFHIFPTITASDSTNLTSTSAGDLALFSGSGDISLPIHGIGTSGGSGSGTVNVLASTAARADVTIRYEFDETPEPAASLLFGSGLVGLALLLKKRG